MRSLRGCSYAIKRVAVSREVGMTASCALMGLFCASVAEAHNPVGDKFSRCFAQLDHSLEGLRTEQRALVPSALRRETQILAMQRVDVCLERDRVAVVDDHVVRKFETCVSLCLRGERGERLLATHVVAAHQACDLELLRSVHEQHPVDVVPAAALDEQRYHEHLIRSW